MAKKKPKIKAKRTGIYASTFEQKVMSTIPKRRRIKVSYEPHTIQYTIHGDYTPDFLVSLPSGHSFYVECKGWLKYEDQRKMVAVKQCNPDLDIRMLFMQKNKKYIRWCEKYGFPWAVGQIPEEWYNE